MTTLKLWTNCAMAKKRFTLEDIPNEVLWVLSIKWSKQPAGMTIYNKIQEVVDKYPQYFEWEHQYKAIPQNVHDAFLKECYPERFEPIKWDESINKGEGLMAQISKQEPVKFPSTQKELVEILNNFEKGMNESEQRRIDYEKKVRKIWDKHYRKFGLECRENF
jgi:hypothetical protein